MTNLWEGNVTVPPDFLGMCIHRWPGTSPKPTYRFQTWRAHDYEGVLWRDIHLAPGKFDFSRFDAAKAANKGRKIQHTIWGTPRWCSSMPDERDPYGGFGGNAPPTSMEPLAEFVHELAPRVDILETFNEPTFPGNGMPFWLGPIEPLAAMCRTVNKVATARNPSIVHIGPSHCGYNEIPWFCNADDGSGGCGRDHIDGLSFHPYGTTLDGFDLEGLGSPQWITNQLRTKMSEGGLPPDFPIYGTEQGIALEGPALEWPSLKKAKFVALATALYAALGWKMVTWYSHDDPFSGNPAEDEIVSAALDWCSRLGGKTITSIDAIDGSVLVKTTALDLLFKEQDMATNESVVIKTKDALDEAFALSGKPSLVVQLEAQAAEISALKAKMVKALELAEAMKVALS
jgi:hypothetical protein